MSAERMFAPTPSQYPEVLRQCRDLCRVEKALVKSFRSPWQSDLKEAPSSPLAKEAARGTGRDKAPVQTQEEAGDSV